MPTITALGNTGVVPENHNFPSHVPQAGFQREGDEMGGRRMVTAVTLVIGWGLVGVATGQQAAPVVSIRQPLSFVNHQRACQPTCALGLPCGVCKASAACDPPSCVVRTESKPTGGSETEAVGIVNSDGGSARKSDPRERDKSASQPKSEYRSQQPTRSKEAPSSLVKPAGLTVVLDEAVAEEAEEIASGTESSSCNACSTMSCGSGCTNLECQDWSFADLCTCRGNDRGLWARADYLLWWTQNDNIPPLVTSSQIGTPIDDAGVLGLLTTSTHYDGPLTEDVRSGGRIRLGYWMDGRRYGLDGSLWGVENLHEDRDFSSRGNPTFARPFFNVDPAAPGPDARVVSFDTELDGSIAVTTSSELYAGNLGLRCNVRCDSISCDSSSHRLDLIAGYRFFRIREGLQISDSREVVGFGGPLNFGTTIDSVDRFHTANEFHGGEIGMIAATQHGRWFGELLGKVAFGNIERNVRIEGLTTTTDPGVGTTVASGGLLAQPTNMGSYEDAEFSVLPEFQANLGYHVDANLRLLVGYTFLYLGDVVRPGDTIDPAVNGTLLDPLVPFSGSSQPSFSFRDTDMWVMGINFGVEYTF